MLLYSMVARPQVVIYERQTNLVPSILHVKFTKVMLGGREAGSNVMEELIFTPKSSKKDTGDRFWTLNASAYIPLQIVAASLVAEVVLIGISSAITAIKSAQE